MVELVAAAGAVRLPRLAPPARRRRRSEFSRPRALFAAITADQLLAYGVPPDWIAPCKRWTRTGCSTSPTHLPAEAMDALLELAVGGSRPCRSAPPAADPFAHPDAQRRFRVIANQEELRLALDYPWEKWTVFLHPAQRELVERRYGGPARVSGSAGTGKTVVALHRAAHLARQSADARVLLATFSKTLAQALKVKLGRLIDPSDAAASRITVGLRGRDCAPVA